MGNWVGINEARIGPELTRSAWRFARRLVPFPSHVERDGGFFERASERRWVTALLSALLFTRADWEMGPGRLRNAGGGDQSLARRAPTTGGVPARATIADRTRAFFPLFPFPTRKVIVPSAWRLA
jgi:hypothetical protein